MINFLKNRCLLNGVRVKDTFYLSCVLSSQKIRVAILVFSDRNFFFLTLICNLFQITLEMCFSTLKFFISTYALFILRHMIY